MSSIYFLLQLVWQYVWKFVCFFMVYTITKENEKNHYKLKSWTFFYFISKLRSVNDIITIIYCTVFFRKYLLTCDLSHHLCWSYWDCEPTYLIKQNKHSQYNVHGSERLLYISRFSKWTTNQKSISRLIILFNALFYEEYNICTWIFKKKNYFADNWSLFRQNLHEY